MRIARFLFSPLVLLMSATAAFGATSTEGVALAIVYDTSGSMGERVRSARGSEEPKFVIANRALMGIAKHIQAYVAAKETVAIEAALFTFRDHGPNEVIPLSKFDAKKIEDFAQNFHDPNGDTPLGITLQRAGERLLDSKLPRKHILVITDGVNTAGPKPEVTLPNLKRRAETQHSAVDVHFVAFDVNAKVFAPLKKMGATVLPAADERQLNTQLDFIVRKQILLEDEEPQKTTK